MIKKKLTKIVAQKDMPTVEVSKGNGKSLAVTNVTEVKPQLTKTTKPVKGGVTPKTEPKKEINFIPMLLERDKLKEQMKLLEERVNAINDTLREVVSNKGTKDDKGSLYFTFNDGEKDRLMGLQARKSVSINKTKAEELFKKMKLWDKVTKVVTETKIDEKLVEQAVSDKKLTLAQLESVTDIKITTAFVVDPDKRGKKEE